jgi:hypothetical protein
VPIVKFVEKRSGVSFDIRSVYLSFVFPFPSLIFSLQCFEINFFSQGF